MYKYFLSLGGVDDETKQEFEYRIGERPVELEEKLEVGEPLLIILDGGKTQVEAEVVSEHRGIVVAGEKNDNSPFHEDLAVFRGAILAADKISKCDENDERVWEKALLTD